MNFSGFAPVAARGSALPVSYRKLGSANGSRTRIAPHPTPSTARKWLILLAGDATVWRQSTRAQESVPPPFHLMLNSEHSQAACKIRTLTAGFGVAPRRQPGTAGRRWFSAAGATVGLWQV